MISFALLIGLMAPDVVLVEAARLEARAEERGATAGGAVDLMRLGELAAWLPAGDVEGRLRVAAEDGERAPLVRAVAWWLVRELALRRLDPAAASEAVGALGLVTAFVVRPGPAPAPTDALSREGWRRAPATGFGELRLEGFLRPNREVRAAAAVRLRAPTTGPAVLRLGYDDRVRVFLNGDEVYAAHSAHQAWLDQAAVPVVLRAGDNRLVVEVAQRTGAWRLIARVTDVAGRPLGVTAHADPWGPVPQASERPPPEAYEHLWATLLAAHEREPPEPQALRDLADYARRTGLPDDDQVVPRVAMEGAWEADPGPRTLHAWLRLLPTEERAAVRADHPLDGAAAPEDRYAELHLSLLRAWQHYYARRHRETRVALEGVADDDGAGYPPAARLRAVLLEDLGLPNTAVAELVAARARWPGRAALRGAHISALRSAGRVHEMLAELRRLRADGVAAADDLYQLGLVLAARGETDAALEALDAVTAARPELWTYALEAVEVLLDVGRRAEGVERLEALAKAMPGDRVVAERLARQYVEGGRRAEAIPLLKAAVAASPGDAELRDYLASLTDAAPVGRLGPPVETLLAAASPAGPAAHVLYHHARTEVDAGGLAVRRIRRVVRLLTDEGARRYGTVELTYVPGAQRLEVQTARLLREGRPPASPRISDRDLSEPEYRLYYDLRAEVLSFARPRPGDVVEVEWRVADTDPDPAFPGYYGELAYLQEAIPRAASVVEFAGPPRLRAEVVGHGLEVERRDGVITMRDVPAVVYEHGMPGLSSSRAYVHLSTAGTWAEIHELYRRLLDERDAPTKALAELARRWAGDARDPEEVMGRLYTAVADKTRYVGLEFGVHSFKPELPAVTLARGYGDCKDKATLLIALARALGIEAHLTLVRTRRSGAITASPASLAVFDHAIVYAPALGRYLDPTVDRNDPWTLPPSDQGATAFVLGVHDAPRPIPHQPAAHNRTAWRLEVELDEVGRAKGTASWQTRGHPATVARRALEAEGARREVAERALARNIPGARLTAPRFDGLDPAADPVSVSAHVELPAFPRRDGGYDVALAPWDAVRAYAQSAERETPLQIEFLRTREVHLEARIPVGFSARLPPEVSGSSEFGTWRIGVHREGPKVALEAALSLSASEVSPAAYPRFRRWLADLDRAIARPVEVRRE